MGCTIAPEEGMSWANDLLSAAKATGTVDLGFALSMTDAAAAEIAPVVAAARPTALRTPSWPRPKAPLTAAGFGALCTASSPSLTWIDLTEAAVPNVSPEHVAAVLGGLTNVKKLCLHGATLPRQILTRMARSMADSGSRRSSGLALETLVPPPIRRLTLGGAGVDHVALAAASRAFPLLEELTVTELPSGADVEAILAVLHRTRATFPLLRRFDAGPAPLSAAARDSLRRLCPMLVLPSPDVSGGENTEATSNPLLVTSARHDTIAQRSMSELQCGGGAFSSLLAFGATDTPQSRGQTAGVFTASTTTVHAPLHGEALVGLGFSVMDTPEARDGPTLKATKNGEEAAAAITATTTAATAGQRRLSATMAAKLAFAQRHKGPAVPVDHSAFAAPPLQRLHAGVEDEPDPLVAQADVEIPSHVRVWVDEQAVLCCSGTCDAIP